MRPMRTSSFMRSKIRILASTAIPMERMKPPMCANSRVMGIILKIASTMMA